MPLFFNSSIKFLKNPLVGIHDGGSTLHSHAAHLISDYSGRSGPYTIYKSDNATKEIYCVTVKSQAFKSKSHAERPLRVLKFI